jgi:hypothetical protein
MKNFLTEILNEVKYRIVAANAHQGTDNTNKGFESSSLSRAMKKIG